MRPEEYAELLADELRCVEWAMARIEDLTYDDTSQDVDEALADLESGHDKLRKAIDRLRGKKTEG